MKDKTKEYEEKLKEMAESLRLAEECIDTLNEKIKELLEGKWMYYHYSME